MSILEVNHLQKIYVTRFGGTKVQALTDVSFSVERGEYVAIMGESGSGKTTLLNILAALDRPTAGEVVLEGHSLSSIRERDLAAFRREQLGFVFQDFNLLDTFSVQDNIFLPLVLSGTPYPEMRSRLEPLAAQLGLTPLLQKFPYELSGGQKQRTAVARALITQPKLLRARLQEHRRAAAPVREHQSSGTNHPHGDALGQGREPRLARAVHQGRRGVPPDLPRRGDGRGAVSEDLRHPHDAGDGR